MIMGEIIIVCFWFLAIIIVGGIAEVLGEIFHKWFTK